MNDESRSDEVIEQEIEAGERELERIAKGMIHGADGKAIITEEYDWQMFLKRFERTAMVLASTDRAVTATFKRWGVIGHKLKPLGCAMHFLCVNALPLVKRAEKGFTLKGRSFRKADGSISGTVPGKSYTFTHAIPNPYITVMLRACMQIAKKLSDFYVAEWADVSIPEVRAAFEHAALYVRRICRSKRFKAVLYNHWRSAEKNRKSNLDYVTSLFEKSSKLLVLRIDIYIHPDHHEWSESDRAEWCISQYLRALRENRLIEPEVKGWIVKREGGFYRGIHFHLMVFLDGHKHQAGHVYSEQLGEAWKNRFSEGKGTYFNCWALRKKYKYNALGVVHITNRLMLMGIRIAVTYLTKEDCALETGRLRNLRRGIIHRLDGESKRGAPRKAENDLSLVKQVFFGCSAQLLF